MNCPNKKEREHCRSVSVCVCVFTHRYSQKEKKRKLERVEGTAEKVALLKCRSEMYILSRCDTHLLFAF